MEGAVEAEAVQVPVDAEKSLLVHVAGVVWRPQQVRRQPEHAFVVRQYQLLERVLVALLRRANQAGIIHCHRRSAGSH